VTPAVLTRVVCAVAATVALAGCGTGGYTSAGNVNVGKKLFVQACGACHTLAQAGTKGTIGPNLDDAFAQAREAGMTSSTFRQVVHDQIYYAITKPSTGSPGMPPIDQTLPVCSKTTAGSFCVPSQSDAARDIATYVSSVAGTGVPAAKATSGKAIFQTAGCKGCHTLADAGATGTLGPNLDQVKPPKALVVQRVTNGKGQMPPFKTSLDPQQIQAVATYVSSVAGKK
jgi:mono/diheme cytochrome c family protein